MNHLAFSEWCWNSPHFAMLVINPVLVLVVRLLARVMSICLDSCSRYTTGSLILRIIGFTAALILSVTAATTFVAITAATAGPYSSIPVVTLYVLTIPAGIILGYNWVADYLEKIRFRRTLRNVRAIPVGRSPTA